MATATTNFFNAYAAALHEGDVDWSTGSYDLYLFANANALDGTETIATLNANRISTNISSTPGENGDISINTQGTVNTDGFRVTLNDADVVASGGSVTFRYTALVGDYASVDVPLCWWNWGSDQVITNGGTASFTFDATNGLFTFQTN